MFAIPASLDTLGSQIRKIIYEGHTDTADVWPR
jgi:hypothetical protein